MKLKKLLAAVTVGALTLTLAGCTPKTDSTMLSFTSYDRVAFSNQYFELKKDKRNKTETWRNGMVSGNGMQGFITSGSPSSDSIIYQNMHFIMPNDKTRSCPVTVEELEGVKQNITNGEDIVDNASYDEVYYFHPGGALRIEPEIKGSVKDYVRYTDYESAQVGLKYTDKNGTWERTSFTSKADGVSITKITKSDKDSKVNVELSFDDLATMANFGDGDEKGLQYKRILCGDNALALVAHYPSYEGSELIDGGYATVVYVVNEKGELTTFDRDRLAEEQDVGTENKGISVKDSEAVYLISVTGRDHNMGKLSDFSKQEKFSLVDDLANKAKSVADKYTKKGKFAYDKALDAHKAIFTPQYNSVSFELEGSESNQSDADLIKAGRSAKTLDASLVEKAYYSGRYAYLCCAGYSTSRLYGMWTGEFNTGWGSKYTMDANVNLQTSSMNSSNMTDTYMGYVNFILRQLPDWEENALATHDFKNAIQAPVNTDGDKAIINETCYPYPFRYWNAGASWLIRPMFETWQSYGNVKVPLNPEFDLNNLKSVLDLSDKDVKSITKRGYLMLEEDILYPLLVKSCNYWEQLTTPEYYTNDKGETLYEKGKTKLNDGEYYTIVPSYSPENNPSNYPSPSTANCAIDISALKDNIDMLKTISKDMGKKVDAKFTDLYNHVPPYLYDETGALKEWADKDFDENNEHRHLSHLYCAWPVGETMDDEQLTVAAESAIANRASENSASHALIHRGLIADRLHDSSALTEALQGLMKSKIYYDSLMTNHNFKRNSCYCTDYAIGYLGMINEALVYSKTGVVDLLPALPDGISAGVISGLRLNTRAVADEIRWNVEKGEYSITITSDIDQKIVVNFGSESQTVVLKAGETQAVTFNQPK